MLKTSKWQLCLHSNIGALLRIEGLQGELVDALIELQKVWKILYPPKLDSVLGRLNGVLAEAQNVANMINWVFRWIIAIPIC